MNQHVSMRISPYLTAIALNLATLLFLSLAPALADNVFRWADEKGVVHYTSKPLEQNSKPAALPPITRGEVKVTAGELLTCKSHGDINCEAGADKDG